MALLDSFQPVAGDQSIAYLSILFGGLSQIPGNPGILATLFKTFNSIVLVVGLFVVVYTVIVGLITTAHEGEFLAKKFHSLWTPVRMVIGIASLVPTPTGYSGLQVIIMWVFIQGIGAADTLWNTALVYVEQNGFYGKVTDTPITFQSTVNDHLQNLFKGLTCVASTSLPVSNLASSTADAFRAYKDNGFTGYDTGTSAPVALKSCSAGQCTLTFNNNVNCGTLIFSDPSVGDDVTKNINRAQQTVLIGSSTNAPQTITLSATAQNNSDSILNKLYYLASFFAYSDQQYLNFYYQSPLDPDNLPDETSDPNMQAVSMGGSDQGKPWGWMNDYCSDKNITPCCRPGSPDSACSQAGGANTNPRLFPSPSVGLSSGPTDADPKAAEIFFQYNIKPNALLNPAFSALGLQNADRQEFFSNIFKKLSSDYAAAIAAATPAPELSNLDLIKIRDRGWLFAGGYYYYVTTFNATGQKTANPTLSFNLPDQTSSNFSIYRNNINAAGKILKGAAQTSPTSDFTGVIDGIRDETLGTFMKNVTGGATDASINPLIRMQSFGQQLLLVVEITYPIVLAIDIGLSVLATAGSVQVLGTGAAQGLWPLLSVINTFSVPLFFGLYGILTAIGGLLAVYVPLIPYVIFTMAALGWFISIVEALVAAPLIAVGILSPSAQHHEILGKAEGALMTIFSIFLKPSLMIFGLIVAMLLATIGVGLVNATFEQVVSDIIAHQEPAGGGPVKQNYIDLLELIFFMAAYLFLVVAVLNKCFSVIATLPGKVMTYIGGQAEGPEADALGDVKGAVGSAGAQTAGALGGTRATGGIEAGQKAKEQAQKAKVDRAQKDKGTPTVKTEDTKNSSGGGSSDDDSGLKS